MKPVIIANWKMNLTGSQAQNLATDISNGAADYSDKVSIIICPPFTALGQLGGLQNIDLGAQDIHWEDQGTFTGEISGAMLRDLKCRYVIVGHSERRWQMNENNDVINKKLLAALRYKLIPILCVGERADDKAAARTASVLQQQLSSAWRGIGRDDFSQIIIAYEPVWAIGTGAINSRVAANATEIIAAYKVIKEFLEKENVQDKVSLIYGGSVDSVNINNFLKLDDNGGFLVGGASLQAAEFLKIIAAVATSYNS